MTNNDLIVRWQSVEINKIILIKVLVSIKKLLSQLNYKIFNVPNYDVALNLGIIRHKMQRI